MNIVANYSEIIHTTNFLDKFLSDMTNMVSSIPSAANPCASENRARKINALMPLNQDCEIFPGRTKGLPAV